MVRCNIASPATLLKAAYVIVGLDTLLAVFFVGIAIYVRGNCPQSMVDHVTFMLHFVQTLAILSAIDDWHTDLKGEDGHIKAYSPALWIASSILSLIGDVCLLVYQLSAVHLCETLTKLHIILDSLGIVICFISILWFIIVAAAVKSSLAKRKELEATSVSVFERPYF